jgi:hypothetical protein
MKILITHINPHLDDICAIWLFKKYHARFKDAKIEFISASRNLAAKEENENKIFLGTGGGRFDEHKEGMETCAGSLVYDFLKAEGFIPEDECLQKALERLVEWNKLVDTGRAPASEFSEFSVQSFIRTKDSNIESSLKSVALGEEILNRTLSVLKRKEHAEKDWQGRVEFESSFGKSYAIISENIDREFCREKDGRLFLMYHPRHNAVQFFTPSFQIDLEPLYKKLQKTDPEAPWFLHQGHHMVICGSASAPEGKPTRVSFEELIEIAKEV